MALYDLVLQGYLAQVLSFEHELSVIAIDASSHHGSITDARAKRIEKYYAAKLCKSRYGIELFKVVVVGPQLFSYTCSVSHFHAKTSMFFRKSKCLFSCSLNWFNYQFNCNHSKELVALSYQKLQFHDYSPLFSPCTT